LEAEVKDKGLYILLIHLPEGREIEVGALGSRPFRRGFYAYVGSALGGLQGRVARHLRRKKRRRWHIDYLLEHAHVKEVLTIPVEAKGEPRLECTLARSLAEGLYTIEGFGSSDCRCKGHLFYCPDFELLRQNCLKAMKDIATTTTDKGILPPRSTTATSSLKGQKG